MNIIENDKQLEVSRTWLEKFKLAKEDFLKQIPTTSDYDLLIKYHNTLNEL